MSFDSCAVWDFPQVLSRRLERDGLIGLWSCDAFVERSFLSRRLHSGKKWRTVLGKEFTVSLLEECFCQRDLFSECHHLLVLQAERMPSSSCDFVMRPSFKMESGGSLLAFSKESSFFKTLSKKFPEDFFKLTPPKFWEGGRLLEFFCKERDIPLPRSIRDYLVDILPMNSSAYCAVLDRIKLDFSRTETLSLDDVRSLIDSKKLDHFDLAAQFGRRKVVYFFKQLVSLDGDFESLCFLFSFMQRHLLRLLDTSYIQKKARPSRYDREVGDHAVLWKSDEIVRQMRLFGRLEMEAKKRSPFLKSYLRVLSLSGQE